VGSGYNLVKSIVIALLSADHNLAYLISPLMYGSAILKLPQG
jgi:hypothetical protein